MPFLLFYLLAALVLAEERIWAFDNTQVAPCARSCKILTIAELNCVPPAAPISNNATYIDCFCHSDYIRSLHSSSKICHHACSDEDVLVISNYYDALCGLPYSSSSSSYSSNPTSPPAPSPTSSLLDDAPREPSTPSSADSQGGPENHRTWFHENWKYFLLVAVLILTTFLVILSFRFFSPPVSQCI
jgi:hypothetical protein